MPSYLRILFLVIALCVIIGIIGWDIFRRKSGVNPLTKDKFKSSFTDLVLSVLPQKDEQRSAITQPTQDDFKDPMPKPRSVNPVTEKVIAIRIMPYQRSMFSGRALATTLLNAQFRLSAQNIYHRYTTIDEKSPILFTLTSLVEPGTFDPKTIKDRYYPGFLLFMLASPTKDSIAIFEQMLTASRQIAHALNGQLCDSEGHSLTLKTIETLRQQIDQLSVHPAYPSAEITTY